MKKSITVLFAVYVVFLIIQYSILFTSFKSQHHVTPMATGEIRLCINHEPVINYTCSDTTNTSVNYYCLVEATDFDNQTLSYDVTFIGCPEIFNISQEGVINFTPTIPQAGNYTFLITVFDSTGCSNYYDTEVAALEIIRTTNRPPYLGYIIPNQTMNQDSTFTSIDLDDYFFDPDDDPLSYTFTYSSDVTVTISENNEIIFTPRRGFFGTETFFFYAWDTYLLNASSNEVKLTVKQVTSTSSGSSGSSGGGGGGGGSYCLPKWFCTPWGECEPDNLMKRECYDRNNCTTNYLKPNVTQPCEYISTCYDGIKGKDEAGVDCGGKCPPCGTCYDNVCNNNEDCLTGLIAIPDCGGPCKPCNVVKQSCYDNICNNNEDCTKNLTDIPDCGGGCKKCPQMESPVEISFNWLFWLILLLVIVLVIYTIRRTYPYFIKMLKKRKIMMYERRLMLETKIVESILESLKKIEDMLDTADIEKLVMMFSDLIRRYFRNLLDLNYEFTYEELIAEINKRNLSDSFKKVLEGFFNRSLEMEYSGKNILREEIRAMISEFKVILSLTSSEPLKTDTPKILKNLSKIDRIYSMITEAELSLRKKDINKAFELYIGLNREFNTIDPVQKKRLHGFLTRLYEEIKLAREEFL